MISTERNHAISAMRVLAMLMIISFHSLCFYTHRWWRLAGIFIPVWDKTAILLNAIDLPMFVFISGFLLGHLYIKGKYRKWQPFLQGKAHRLLVPYLFWGMFLIITMPSLHEWFNMFTGISHLWFLLMLFEVFTITIPLADFLCLKATKCQAIVIISGAYALFLVYHTFSEHLSFLCIDTTLNYLPAFLVGLFCARFDAYRYLSVNWTIRLFLISLISLAFYCYAMSPLSFYANDILLRLLGYAIVIALFSLLYNMVINEQLYKVIVHFDRLSMGIYIFNQICVNVLLLDPTSVTFLNQHYQIGPIIIFAVGFFIPWLLSYIFNSSKYIKWTIG